MNSRPGARVGYNARILPTRHIHNLRDYGGYGLHDGRRLRSGLLFRSAQHSEASDEDLAVVAGLGLEAIIDLRSAEERAARPSRASPGSRAQILSSAAYGHARPPHSVDVDATATSEEVRQKLTDYYIESPFRSEQITCLRMYFDTLLKIDGPTLVHCAAGKDRTGIAVALFHAAVGVAREDIVSDYLLTNQAGDLQDRVAAFSDSIYKHLGDNVSDETVSIALSVEPGYLAATFQTIDRRCGGIAGYFDEYLGFGRAALDRLATKYAE